MSPAPPPPSIPGSKGDADTFFPVETGAANESNAPLESTQKKMVLRRHAECILHPGGVDCGMFRQTGGPGGADSGAYVHVRATVGPSESARGEGGGVRNLFKYDVGFTFTLVLAALQHFCIFPLLSAPGSARGFKGGTRTGPLEMPRGVRVPTRSSLRRCASISSQGAPRIDVSKFHRVFSPSPHLVLAQLFGYAKRLIIERAPLRGAKFAQNRGLKCLRGDIPSIIQFFCHISSQKVYDVPSPPPPLDPGK